MITNNNIGAYMKKWILILLTSVFTINGVAEVQLSTTFSSPQECSTYYQTFYNDPTSPLGLALWGYNFADLAAYTGTSSQQSCSNGKCTYTYKFYFTSANYPAAGGCALVNTVFWSEAQQEIAAVQQDLNATNNTKHKAIHYGVTCQNTTGKAPSADFSGCKLSKATN
ncbi:MAG: hypothetical protein HWD59_06285 [Coxiellaceae bacterium]|nr:MAG: hypothetical protein HWD59_06285 [Coxiellaceae bacterium]